MNEMLTSIQNIRPLTFLLVLITLLLWQRITPSFKNAIKKRTLTNSILFISGIVVMKIAFPFGLIGLAQSFQMPHEYLFELYQLNPIVSFILTILIFDLAIYWQHRVFHLIPYLWRFHEIHHCDKEMDLTTALRFHPGEILISALYKSLLIFLFRPSVEAYIVYEIILVSMALFNHANIKISPKFDKYLRLLVVTPNMHYTHHSVENRLMNLNFGNAFSFWDRIFISYTIERETKEGFGIKGIDQKKASSVLEQLKSPFI